MEKTIRQPENRDVPVVDYPLLLDTQLFNEHGMLMISSYQQAFSTLFEKHLSDIGMDVPSTVAHFGVAWIMLSLSIEVHRAIHPEETLIAQTWHTQRHGPVYRREFFARDASGAHVIRGAGFFSLLDIKRRRLCTSPAVHARFTLPEGEQLIEADSRFAQEGLAFMPVETRRVRPSWLDGLGHVNNRRYGEIAYDALTPQERARMDRLRRLDIYFRHELTAGDEVLMERAQKQGEVFLRGSLSPAGTQSFIAHLLLD